VTCLHFSASHSPEESGYGTCTGCGDGCSPCHEGLGGVWHGPEEVQVTFPNTSPTDPDPADSCDCENITINTTYTLTRTTMGGSCVWAYDLGDWTPSGTTVGQWLVAFASSVDNKVYVKFVTYERGQECEYMSGWCSNLTWVATDSDQLCTWSSMTLTQTGAGFYDCTWPNITISDV